MLLSDPLSQLFQSVPQIIAAKACFDRVATFLASDLGSNIRRDNRIFAQKTTGKPSAAYSDDSITKSKLSPALITSSDDKKSAITIQDGYFGWEKDSFVLRDVNIVIPTGQLTMVSFLVLVLLRPTKLTSLSEGCWTCGVREVNPVQGTSWRGTSYSWGRDLQRISVLDRIL